MEAEEVKHVDYSVVRELNTLYIALDIVFLTLLGVLLLKAKNKMAFLFGVAGALIYFIVDYGVFYLLLGTRDVQGAHTVWFLLWLSISYGFTNFVWIWLFLDKDKSLLDWSLFIVIGWFSIALISQGFGDAFSSIRISRGTSGYHGVMAIFLFLGYLFILAKNLMSDPNSRIPVVKLLFVGIIVQFSWEMVLLLSGIRPLDVRPLVINSLLETNLGLPYLFFIHLFMTKTKTYRALSYSDSLS